MNGLKIRTWDSITEASAAIGICISDICASCNGTKITAGGYQWRYVESNIDSLPPTNFSRKVVCIETGETFQHANDAAAKMGISIYKVKKSCLGFKIRDEHTFMYDDMTGDECNDYEENKINSYYNPTPYEKFDDLLVEAVCYNYNPEAGMAEIVKKYNITYPDVRLILETNGIKCYTRHEYDYRNFNDSFFDNIDSSKSAYWLGYLVGKCNISKNVLSLTSNEQYVRNIRRFCDELNIKREISKSCGYYGTQFTSTQLVSSLRRYGVDDRNTIVFPVFDDATFNRDFLRGLFESSGGVVMTMRKGKIDRIEAGIYGCYNICDNVQKVIKSRIGIETKVSKNNNSFRVRLSSNANIDNFLCYLYYDGCYCNNFDEVLTRLAPFCEYKKCTMRIMGVTTVSQ